MMSYRVKMLLPVVGMFLLTCVVVAAVGGDHEIKRPLPPTLDDLAAVKQIEIKDGGGQVVLNGSFTMTTKPNRSVEGEAILAPTGADADAAGKAEVEVSTKQDGRVEKELEVEVRNLAPGASFGVFVDGRQAATFTTNPRGAAELELSNEQPGLRERGAYDRRLKPEGFTRVAAGERTFGFPVFDTSVYAAAG
jgi:hypothetical protein